MEQQHGQVGNTHIHGEGEGGDQKIPIMIRSVSHQDQLGRVIPESQLDKQHQTRSADNVANIQDGVMDLGSRDEYIVGGRDFKDEEPRRHESGSSRSYGGNMDQFNPIGEMTAAMESLSRVKMPFPPIPKLDQFPSHYRGGGDNGPWLTTPLI